MLCHGPHCTAVCFHLGLCTTQAAVQAAPTRSGRVTAKVPLAHYCTWLLLCNTPHLILVGFHALQFMLLPKDGDHDEPIFADALSDDYIDETPPPCLSTADAVPRWVQKVAKAARQHSQTRPLSTCVTPPQILHWTKQACAAGRGQPGAEGAVCHHPRS